LFGPERTQNIEISIEQKEIKAFILCHVIKQAQSSLTSSVILFGCLECLHSIQADNHQFNQNIFVNASRTTNAFVFESFAKLFSKFDALDYLKKLAKGSVEDQMRLCRFMEISIGTSNEAGDQEGMAMEMEKANILIDVALGDDRLVHMRAVSLLQKLEFDTGYLIDRIKCANQTNIISVVGSLKLLSLKTGPFVFKVVEFMINGSSGTDVHQESLDNSTAAGSEVDFNYKSNQDTILKERVNFNENSVQKEDSELEGLIFDYIFIQIKNSFQKDEILLKSLQLAMNMDIADELECLVQLIPRKNKRIEQLRFELIEKILSHRYSTSNDDLRNANYVLYKFVVSSLPNTRVLPILLRILYNLQEFVDVTISNKESFCYVFLELFNEWDNIDSAIMFLIQIFSNGDFESYSGADNQGSRRKDSSSGCIKVILESGVPKAICGQLSNENYYVRTQAVFLLTVITF
jgi:hypothetical protein